MGGAPVETMEFYKEKFHAGILQEPAAKAQAFEELLPERKEILRRYTTLR